MQELIILNANEVIVQSKDSIYQDSYENFLKDYRKVVEYKTIDYNKTTHNCVLDGKQADYPNEVCEDIIYQITTLLYNKSQREYIPPSLDELKTQKLEEVRALTEKNITGGFWSNASGLEVYYDSDVDTQITMQGIAINAEHIPEYYPMGVPCRGVVKGDTEKTVQYLGSNEILLWQADLSNHIGLCKIAGWQKQTEVANAKSKEDLDKIVLE